MKTKRPSPAGATQFRPCRSTDFDAVLQLLRQLWPDKPVNPAALREVFDRALASDAQAYLCAVDGDRVIGFASLTIKNSLWHEGRLAHVDELVVEATWRNRGIGAQLLGQIIELARRKGSRRVELDSALYRTDAHRFYQRLGFENRAHLLSKALE